MTDPIQNEPVKRDKIITVRYTAGEREQVNRAAWIAAHCGSANEWCRRLLLAEAEAGTKRQKAAAGTAGDGNLTSEATPSPAARGGSAEWSNGSSPGS